MIELTSVAMALVIAWVKVNENENENEIILLVLAPRNVYQMPDVWYGTEIDSLSTLIVSFGF